MIKHNYNQKVAYCTDSWDLVDKVKESKNIIDSRKKKNYLKNCKAKAKLKLKLL